MSQQKLTRLGLGLAALGRPGYITLGHGIDIGETYHLDSMRSRTWDLLDAASEFGIRYIDTARGYGRAEEFLAGWLESRGIAREEVVVGSKWGYTYTAGWQVDADVHEVKDHSFPTLQRQYHESRALLGPWLRLYQIHSATEASGVLDRSDVLDGLATLRERDDVLLGITLSGPGSNQTLERAMTVQRDGRPLFNAVQATWNLLEPSLGDALAAAHARGVTIIVKEALANGRLTNRNHGNEVALLQVEATRLGCTIDQLALAAVFELPWADCVLSGAATVDQIRLNVGARTIDLDDQARSALAALAEPPEQYWSTRAALRWN